MIKNDNTPIHTDLVLVDAGAGGLLGGVEAARAPDCVAQLRELGYAEACIVGRVVEPMIGDARIRLLSS